MQGSTPRRTPRPRDTGEDREDAWATRSRKDYVSSVRHAEKENILFSPFSVLSGLTSRSGWKWDGPVYSVGSERNDFTVESTARAASAPFFTKCRVKYSMCSSCSWK